MDKLTILSTSDIHLGHHKTPTSFIINNLNTLIPDDKSMADVDIIILAGDVFDTSLYFSDNAISEIEIWMLRLLRLCNKWDITLLILEGTPSHDRKQSKHFINFKENLNIDVDLHYIDKVSIEYFPKFDIHILFIPDEYHTTTLETWNVVQELLLMHNLEKVDYAIMHGMFEHQLPSGLKLPFHSRDNYLSIVKKYIFIGHIHQMSVYDRILSHGSPDRLCHGDEMDKGLWKVISYRNSFDSDKLEFVINENSMIYRTVSWLEMEYENILDSMSFVKELRPYSNIRIELRNDEKLIGLYNSLVESFPMINWTMKKVKDVNAHDVSIRLSTFQPIVINDNTIESIVIDKLSNLGIDGVRKEKILSLLQTVK